MYVCLYLTHKYNKYWQRATIPEPAHNPLPVKRFRTNFVPQTNVWLGKLVWFLSIFHLKQFHFRHLKHYSTHTQGLCCLLSGLKQPVNQCVSSQTWQCCPHYLARWDSVVFCQAANWHKPHLKFILMFHFAITVSFLNTSAGAKLFPARSHTLPAASVTHRGVPRSVLIHLMRRFA